MTDKPVRPEESFIDRLRRSGASKSVKKPEEPVHDLLAFDVRPESSDAPASHTTDPQSDSKVIDSADRMVSSFDKRSGESRLDSAQDFAQDSADELPDTDSDSSESTAPEPRMPAEARRVLVSLMRQGVVLASKKAKVFEALVRHQAPIREHLAEVYLQLVLDERAGVAFVASHVSEHGLDEAEAGDSLEDPDDDSDGVSLISRRTLSLYDTLLLLVLRKHYQDREVAGEQRIIIDTERVEAALVPFLPLTNSERSDRRKLSSALTRMVEKRLLTRVRGSDERFEITPVIRYVVSAEFLESLLKEYVRLAGDSNDEH